MENENTIIAIIIIAIYPVAYWGGMIIGMLLNSL